MEDLLFAERPVAPDLSNRDPLVVVGLPRSGSSFLSEVISQIDDWYVFDDLYLQREAAALGAAEGPLTEVQLEKLLVFLGWQIRARLRFTAFATPAVAEDEIEPMNAALMAAFRDRPVTWSELQEEWMVRLARRRGCARWGYKMPQGFLELDRLFDVYPNMKVIFLLRRPHDVLASFKHMRPDSEDGHPDQYHPVPYAYYWRMAARAALVRRSERVLLTRFEDLIGNTDREAERIAAFLGARFRGIRADVAPNSSFSGARRSLTGLETWLLNRVAGAEMAVLGYALQPAAVALGDVADLVATTGRFAAHSTRRLRRGGPLHSAKIYLRGLLGTQSRKRS